MEKRFTFYTPERIAQARLAFRQLNITGPEGGDRFFEAYCPGNTTNIIDKPFERFEDYEMLLKIIRDDDQTRYETIHKGTPFYFLAWAAFDLRNYGKAIFYMNAAIMEDIRKDPINWLNNPASQFLTLNPQGNQAAVRITSHLKDLFEKELSRFNLSSSLPAITTDEFINKFVKVLVDKKENHSIITALYSYILEFEDREKELSLRSRDGGSIELVLTYLFKGGLIFESLLKYLYPKRNNGVTVCLTLKDIFKTTNFKTDFIFSYDKSATTTLQNIVDKIGNSDLETAFNTASRLRNTSGHNLIWDDIFNKSDNFKKLYIQQVNAILYIIQKKFI